MTKTTEDLLSLAEQVAVLTKEVKRLQKEIGKPEDNLFKRRIAELGLKHVDIALVLNIDPAAVSHLVSRKRQLRAIEVIPLAKILKVEPIEVLEYLHKDMHERIKQGGVRWG